MRVRKIIYVLTFVLAMFVATSNSNAAAFVWTGLGDGTSWDDGFNWDQLGVPPHDSGDVFLGDQTNGSLITIDSDVAADCTFGHASGWGTIFGPEFGMDLDIYGGLTYQWYMAAVNDDANDRTVINMFDGSSLYGAEGLAVGDTWWWSGGPHVTMNMYGNSSADINHLWFGGHLNVYDGVMDIAGGVSMSGNIADDLMRINITDGMIILPDPNFVAIAQDWESRGILMAFGGSGDVIIDTELNPGRTTLTGVIPEPATIALMCLGGIALIRKKRS